jgi:hypothetical protein
VIDVANSWLLHRVEKNLLKAMQREEGKKARTAKRKRERSKQGVSNVGAKLSPTRVGVLTGTEKAGAT